MMNSAQLVASIAALRDEDLEIWIGKALVRPVEEKDAPVFGDAECARVQLICTLHYDMEIETDTLPVVLDLIDQLHEAHYRLRALGDAVIAQDEKIRHAILEKVKARDKS